mgnify:CR=1 FL=1
MVFVTRCVAGDTRGRRAAARRAPGRARRSRPAPAAGTPPRAESRASKAPPLTAQYGTSSDARRAASPGRRPPRCRRSGTRAAISPRRSIRRDHERDVLDLDRNAHAGLDEVTLGVALEDRPEVGEDPGVGDRDVVVEPVAVDVDPEARQPPPTAAARRLVARRLSSVAITRTPRWRRTPHRWDRATARSASPVRWRRRGTAAERRSGEIAADAAPVAVARHRLEERAGVARRHRLEHHARPRARCAPAPARRRARVAEARARRGRDPAPAMSATRRPLAAIVSRERLEEPAGRAGRRPGRPPRCIASWAKLASTGTIRDVAPARRRDSAGTRPGARSSARRGGPARSRSSPDARASRARRRSRGRPRASPSGLA